MVKQGLLCAALAASVVTGPAFAQQQLPSMTTQTATITRTPLQSVDVPGSNYQVVLALVEIPANVRTGRHTHPGTVFGYLMDGDYVLALDGQAEKAFRPGETVRIEAGVIHDEGAGARPAKFLSVFTIEKGKPLATPVR